MASPEFQRYLAKLPARRFYSRSEVVGVRDKLDAATSVLPVAPDVSARKVVLGGVAAIECIPVSGGGTAIVWFHGGGYRIGSSIAYRSFASWVAAASGARVVVPDYALAPEHPFPAAFEDAVAVYEAMIVTTGAAGTIVAGDSAGGGLAVAMVLDALRRGAAAPAGIACVSPWVDLTNEADSFVSRADADRVFSKRQADEGAAWYLDGHDPHDVRASPLFSSSLAGLPPLLVLVGDCEVLFDDANRLAQRAEADGVAVTHRVWADMPHVWPLQCPAFPEAVEAVDEIGRFVRRVVR